MTDLRCSACEYGQLRAGAHTETCRRKADALAAQHAFATEAEDSSKNARAFVQPRRCPLKTKGTK